MAETLSPIEVKFGHQTAAKQLADVGGCWRMLAGRIVQVPAGCV